MPTQATPASRRVLSRPARLAGALLLMAGAIVASPAPGIAQNGIAQPGAIRHGDDLPSASEQEQRLITEKAVDVLTRAVLTRLRRAKNPTADDFKAAALSLRIIRRLAPEDAELLRMEIEAWTTAGEDDEALAGAQRLLRIRPDDEVAQIRVTLAGIRRLNDVDSRLRAYDRLLGPRGAAIDPAVRSRLAFDAALLARENGADDAFLDYLTRATTLDPTNKQAAATFGALVLGRTEDPLERLDVLENIILADPLDPGAYENLAFEVLRHGAYAAALRALTIATSITLAGGGQMTPQRLFDFALCEWRVFGPEQGPVQASARIQRVLQESVMAEEQRQARQEALGLAVEEREGASFLPPEVDMLRLAIAVAVREETGVTLIMDGFLAANDMAVENQLAKLRDAETPQARREARTTIQVYKLQRLWGLLFSNVRIEEAEPLLREILAENTPDPDEQAPTNPPPLAPEVVHRFEGWLAMRNGEDARAAELLEPLVEVDQNARWCMAVLREQQGNTREAMIHYARLSIDNPRSALGSAGWSRLIELRGGVPVAPTPLARELDDRFMRFAPWLNTFVSDPSSFMSISVRHDAMTAGPLDRTKVFVTVRNTSMWPLGVGASRPIPKRVMLAPSMRLRAQDASQLAEPLVVIIPDHLRLEPSEETTVTCVLSRESIGTLLDLTPTFRASLRWQAVQNFVTTPNKGYTAGAMTVTTLSDVLVRTNLDDSVPKEELVARIAIRSGASLMTDILLALRGVREALEGAEGSDPGAANRLINAVADRLPSMPEIERAIALGWVAESNLGQEDSYAPVFRRAMDGVIEPFSGVAILAGLIHDADDPLLGAYLAADDNDLPRLAFITRQLLRDAAPAPTPE